MEQEFTEFSEFRESDKSLKHELHWQIQGGGVVPRTSVRGSKFFHFRAVFGKKKLQNNRTLRVGAPPPSRKILYPPLNCTQFKDCLCYLCLACTVVASWSLTQEVAGSQVRVLLL